MLLLHLEVRLQASELILGEAYAYPQRSMDSTAFDHQQAACHMSESRVPSRLLLMSKVARLVAGVKHSCKLFHYSDLILEEKR